MVNRGCNSGLGCHYQSVQLAGGYNGVASVVRLPAVQIRSCLETMAMMLQAVQEIEAGARAIGVNLDVDIVQESMDSFDGFPDDATASM